MKNKLINNFEVILLFLIVLITIILTDNWQTSKPLSGNYSETDLVKKVEAIQDASAQGPETDPEALAGEANLDMVVGFAKEFTQVDVPEPDPEADSEITSGGADGPDSPADGADAVGSDGLPAGSVDDFILVDTSSIPAFANQTRLIDPLGIVLHWTGGEYSDGLGMAQAMGGRRDSACPNGCSVQLTIDKEGNIYQLKNDVNTRMIHACGVNNTTIGIEIESSSKNNAAALEEELLNNQAQYDAVVKAVSALLVKFPNISRHTYDAGNGEGIIGHLETAATHPGCAGKADPGAAYMQKVRADIAQRFQPRRQ